MSYLKYRLQMEDGEKILYFKAREAFPFGKTRSRKKKNNNNNVRLISKILFKEMRSFVFILRCLCNFQNLKICFGKMCIKKRNR